VPNTVGQRKGQTCVVGPLARFEAVRSSIAIIGHRRERAGPLEFDGSTEGVTHGEAN